MFNFLFRVKKKPFNSNTNAAAAAAAASAAASAASAAAAAADAADAADAAAADAVHRHEYQQNVCKAAICNSNTKQFEFKAFACEAYLSAACFL